MHILGVAIPTGAIGIVFIAIVLLLLWLFTRPIKLALKLAAHVVCGFVMLVAANWIGGFVGFHLATNFLNCLVAGVFGAPGVVGLIVLKTIFGIAL